MGEFLDWSVFVCLWGIMEDERSLICFVEIYFQLLLTKAGTNTTLAIFQKKKSIDVFISTNDLALCGSLGAYSKGQDCLLKKYFIEISVSSLG